MSKQIKELVSLRGESITRRSVLRGAAAAAGGTVAVLAGTTMPAQAKMTQKAASYQGTPDKSGASCATCSLFQAPSACALVDGTVSPNGWCRFYAKKS